MSDFAIDISELCAGYGKIQVLHTVTLRVVPGQTYGLIGLNGAGKTTMVKTLLGLKTPLSGSVCVFGQGSAEASVRQQISYLPERFDPPWFLKGGEFIDFTAALYGQSVLQEQKEAACHALSLDPAVLSRKVQTYSKGMRQKLGLIATVLTGCQVLIFDEPMSGLDPLARSLVKSLFISLKSQGKTVLLSSHILSDMDEICDGVSVIHQGQHLFSGAPAAMKAETGEESLERAFLKIIGHDPSVLVKAS